MPDMILDGVEWLGHSGFRIELGPTTVYIDPFRCAQGPPADLLLITHDHFDHFSRPDFERLCGPATVSFGPPAVVEHLAGDAHALAPGDEVEAGGVSVRALAAYNTNKRSSDGRPFHPREAGGLGYLLEWRGERLYHAGDTDVIPEMDEAAGCDVALLPVSGTYVMTAQEAAEAARRLAPGVAVPMHWGTTAGSREDALEFARRVAGVAGEPVETLVMEPAGEPVAGRN